MYTARLLLIILATPNLFQHSCTYKLARYVSTFKKKKSRLLTQNLKVDSSIHHLFDIYLIYTLHPSHPLALHQIRRKTQSPLTPSLSFKSEQRVVVERSRCPQRALCNPNSSSCQRQTTTTATATATKVTKIVCLLRPHAVQERTTETPSRKKLKVTPPLAFFVPPTARWNNKS